MTLGSNCSPFASFTAGIFCLMILGALFVCCDNKAVPPDDAGDAVIVDNPSMTKHPTITVRPYEYTNPETGIEYVGFTYSPYHEIGKYFVYGAKDFHVIGPIITKLRGEGFVFSRQRSTYRDITSSEGEHTTMVMLVYEQPTVGSDLSFACIRYTVISGEATSVQLEKLFIGYGNPLEYWVEGDGYDNLVGSYEDGRQIWAQSFVTWSKKYNNDLHQSPMVDPPDPDKGWDWLRYASCVVEDATAGCIAGSVVCAFTAGVDDECSDDACTRAAVSAAIRCAVDQIW